MMIDELGMCTRMSEAVRPSMATASRQWFEVRGADCRLDDASTRWDAARGVLARRGRRRRCSGRHYDRADSFFGRLTAGRAAARPRGGRWMTLVPCSASIIPSENF